MSSRIVLAAVLLASVGCMGCRSTIGKQAFHTVIGAQGKFYEAKAVTEYELAEYRSFKFERFGNDLGAVVPSDVVEEINHQVPIELAESGLFPGGGRQLRITGKIIHYTGRSGLVGGVSGLVGGDGEDCVCRVQLLDGQSGELVGDAVCWGSVKSMIRRGPGEIGKGVGRGVEKWIEKRLPDDVVKQRKEQRREQRERERADRRND